MKGSWICVFVWVGRVAILFRVFVCIAFRNGILNAVMKWTHKHTQHTEQRPKTERKRRSRYLLHRIRWAICGNQWAQQFRLTKLGVSESNASWESVECDWCELRMGDGDDGGGSGDGWETLSEFYYGQQTRHLRCIASGFCGNQCRFHFVKKIMHIDLRIYRIDSINLQIAHNLSMPFASPSSSYVVRRTP